LTAGLVGFIQIVREAEHISFEIEAPVKQCLREFRVEYIVKILHTQKSHEGLGEPIGSYVVFNAMTMMFYHIEKKRNPEAVKPVQKKR